MASPSRSRAVRQAVSHTRRAAPFRLTYATMFDPPALLHDRFEHALARVKSGLGRDQPMWIAGKARMNGDRFEDRSPINTGWLLATFPNATPQDVSDAVSSARNAFPDWRRRRWQDRVRLLRRVVALIERRVYDLGAALALEIGKNRMESLGDVQEAADLIAYYCDAMEQHNGFVRPLARDPLKGYSSTNLSTLRPYGVWAVISPFNFPPSLSAGPAGAALLAGNTVVLKPASDSPWAAALIADCFRDAGLPDGVFSFLTGPGSETGEALIASRVDGITFTGSSEIGMRIFRRFAAGPFARPCILELGGKNPAIVSRRADVETAAMGIMRSAFGLQGQKCSACSRVYVERPIYDRFVARLVDVTSKIAVGDPTERQHWLGPVINAKAYGDFAAYVDELGRCGDIVMGGKQLRDGVLSQGYYCAPTLAAGVPADHRLWAHEMFVPIAMIAAIDSIEEGVQRANAGPYGLTAGFYGSKKEVDWFFEHIEAGVAYANRPQGATTGAWPGFQPFGGWKGSGSSGKNGGGPYYLQLYMREQSRALLE